MRKNKKMLILRELLRNSKRSDRELAKIIKTSQPTITRTRKILEGKLIKTYTLIPDFSKMGYEMLAFTFAKAKTYRRNEAEKMRQSAKEWTTKRPNVVMASEGEGLGKDTVMISFHRNYSEYAEFMRSFAVDLADFVSEFQSFIVTLKNAMSVKPFDIKYLADDIQTELSE
jgi:DNA-binding Lrp family transcriptional regulator